MATSDNLAALARKRAEAERARQRLLIMRHQPDGPGEKAEIALGLLAALRATVLAGQSETDPFQLAHGALCLLPGLTLDEQVALLFDHRRPKLAPVLAQHRQDHSEALTAFIA
ncbi:hypothetical protein, partial [Streptomyces xanthophaeus]|uniref:hypothetical protein n=1 Tax=Streptomyces xanthophaeus TaxID=67385 RepID=UPI00365C7934